MKINPFKTVKDTISEAGKAVDNVSTTQDEYNQTQNTRHGHDMTSDSWLSKNVRPLVLLGLLFFWFFILLVNSFFNITFDATIIDSLKALTSTAFLWYFGTRGGEKIVTRFFKGK